MLNKRKTLIFGCQALQLINEATLFSNTIKFHDLLRFVYIMGNLNPNEALYYPTF